MTFPILGGNSAVGGYAIDNSLRFEQSYLSRTPSSSTTAQRQKFTFSFWMKKRYNADNQFFIIAGTVLTNDFGIYLSAGHNMSVMDRNSGGYHYSNRVLRDDSAWYHICVCVDTTESTAQDRCKIWINGELDSVMYTAFTLNNVGTMNGTYIHYIGQRDYTTNKRFTGYMAEVYMVAGQALTYADFTEFDENSGILKPKEYKGTLTGNSFYLDFENSGSLGADVSGLGNNFTPTNLASTDQTTDTPTNNFCTLNPLANQLGTALSEGNLQQSDTGNDKNCFSTFGLNTGKWYFEVKAVSVGTRGNILITDADHNEGLGTNYARVQLYDGAVLTSATDNGNLSVFSNGDILCVALDLDNGQVWFSKNANINTGTTALVTNLPLTGTNRDYRVSHFGTATGTTVQFNFGNPPFSISSGNSDGNGYGNFEYAPPTGFLSLNSVNLATVLSPTIDDGSQYFNTVLWSGNSVDDRSITGVGFAPDLVSIKQRNFTGNFYWYDTTRGADNQIISNAGNAEQTITNKLQAFESDGFQLGTSSEVNGSTYTYAGWSWKANGGTTSSNTDGTITSTVQANTTAGFSIVTYTGTGSAGTVGHGLGKTPHWVVVKDRTSSGAWYNQHIGNSSASYGQALNTTGAEQIVSAVFNNTRADSSVFYLGDNINVNTNGNSYVAYIFAPIEGYSKFGSFTGNGNNDGVMVTTMFRPSFVMIKRIDSAQNWFIQDIARNTYNVVGKYLRADTSDTEGDFSTSGVDFISNGFKMRTTGTGFNASGGTYIYACFGANPFVTSTGIPVTAR